MKTSRRPINVERNMPPPNNGSDPRPNSGMAFDPASLEQAQQARLVVVETVYYHAGDNPGMAVDVRHGTHLDTDEQAYQRVFRVGHEWAQLNLGWVSNNCHLITVSNDEGKSITINLTAEQSADVAARIVEVGVKPPGAVLPVPFALVRSGESCRFSPTHADQLWVRCRSAVGAKVSMAAFPGSGCGR